MASSTQKSYKLTPEDKGAIVQTSKQLGLDPHELTALFHLESGVNPNIWGGAGGQYRGLIQFGPGARKEVGLPSKEMTISEQLPYVKKYFDQRGFKPGMGIEKAYATVLVGNPGGSLSAKDSFGTSVGAAAPRMKPGGDLYKAAKATLGDLGSLPQTTSVQKPTEAIKQTQQTTQPVDPKTGQPINIYLNLPDVQDKKRTPEEALAYGFLNDFISRKYNSLEESTGVKLNPIELLTNAFNTDYTFS